MELESSQIHQRFFFLFFFYQIPRYHFFIECYCLSELKPAQDTAETNWVDHLPWNHGDKKLNKLLSPQLKKNPKKNPQLNFEKLLCSDSDLHILHIHQGLFIIYSSYNLKLVPLSPFGHVEVDLLRTVQYVSLICEMLSHLITGTCWAGQTYILPSNRFTAA